MQVSQRTALEYQLWLLAPIHFLSHLRKFKNVLNVCWSSEECGDSPPLTVHPPSRFYFSGKEAYDMKLLDLNENNTRAKEGSGFPSLSDFEHVTVLYSRIVEHTHLPAE